MRAVRLARFEIAASPAPHHRPGMALPESRSTRRVRSRMSGTAHPVARRPVLYEGIAPNRGACRVLKVVVTSRLLSSGVPQVRLRVIG